MCLMCLPDDDDVYYYFRWRLKLPYVSALCVCLMCLPYVSALCVCLLCLPYVSVIYNWLGLTQLNLGDLTRGVAYTRTYVHISYITDT